MTATGFLHITVNALSYSIFVSGLAISDTSREYFTVVEPKQINIHTHTYSMLKFALKIRFS